MKTQALLLALVLAMVSLVGAETSTHGKRTIKFGDVISSDGLSPIDVESWQCRACEICGVTIWEQVERVDGQVCTPEPLPLLPSPTFDPMTYLFHHRMGTERLNAHFEYKVCPRCAGAYESTFETVMQRAAYNFIMDSRHKEAECRQENAREDLRCVEAQLRECYEQVKKLTEKIEALKGQIINK